MDMSGNRTTGVTTDTLAYYPSVQAHYAQNNNNTNTQTGVPQEGIISYKSADGIAPVIIRQQDPQRFPSYDSRAVRTVGDNSTNYNMHSISGDNSISAAYSYPYYGRQPPSARNVEAIPVSVTIKKTKKRALSRAKKY